MESSGHSEFSFSVMLYFRFMCSLNWQATKFSIQLCNIKKKKVKACYPFPGGAYLFLQVPTSANSTFKKMSISDTCL